MTVIIDLSPDEQAWLTSTARQAGTEPAILAKRFVTSQMPPLPEESSLTAQPLSLDRQARIAAILAARGSMAYLGVTVEDLHRERQRDKQKEEADCPLVFRHGRIDRQISWNS